METLSLLADRPLSEAGMDVIGAATTGGPTGLRAWTLAIAGIGPDTRLQGSDARAILSRCPEPDGPELYRACMVLALAAGSLTRPRRPDGTPWGWRSVVRLSASVVFARCLHIPARIRSIPAKVRWRLDGQYRMHTLHRA